jgi:phage terminase small subunit
VNDPNWQIIMKAPDWMQGAAGTDWRSVTIADFIAGLDALTRELQLLVAIR